MVLICDCGKQATIKTSWTNRNPGRGLLRFYCLSFMWGLLRSADSSNGRAGSCCVPGLLEGARNELDRRVGRAVEVMEGEGSADLRAQQASPVYTQTPQVTHNIIIPFHSTPSSSRHTVSRPYSSKHHRLLPYHVVADYEAEEDDRLLDADTTGQVLSRTQQWDQSIANKVSEFTATFEKQVLAFNIISRKRAIGEFRSEERLLVEQALLQEERRALFETRSEREKQQKAGRDAHAANMRMAAMAQEQQARAEMMARAPIRASAMGSMVVCMLKFQIS
ncbi:hypothetical protein CTI12_AA546170 [Artemisia annua]|uniref:GLTSCR protein conserved domain-containing protein n=1 Tax=Artemisia annua TaxID=35608 RepID=A0A2U1KZS8_ARTAN|nr:hypothetical protein CTI12_AA546170 [Artemisia annua]